MSDTWLLLGSGPDAPDFLPVAMADYPGATTITTNYGLRLLEKPDYYFILDRKAVDDLGDRALELQKQGCMIVTTHNDVTRPYVERKIPHPDYHIVINGSKHYMKGFICRCRFSGVYMMQFVLLMGAKRLLFVGHNGYPPDQTPYWYEQHREYSQTEYKERTLQVIGPYMRDAARANPDIEFVYYGKLNYEVYGENVRQISELPVAV